MSIFREFNISMIPGKPPLIIHVSQYESDFVYTFNLVSGKSVLAIPDTAIAVIRGTKRDGNGYSKEASLDTENNKVVVIGEAQMTACAGKNVFELAIINDEKTICTANFFLDVERAPLDSDTIRSETVLHDLQAIINSAATATQAAEEASASAESAAESARTAIIRNISTDDAVDGKRVESETGNVTNNVNFSYVEFAVISGDTIEYKTQRAESGIGLAFYDIDSAYISGVEAVAGSQDINVPVNAMFARATYRTAQVNGFGVRVCEAIEPMIDVVIGAMTKAENNAKDVKNIGFSDSATYNIARRANLYPHKRLTGYNVTTYVPTFATDANYFYADIALPENIAEIIIPIPSSTPAYNYLVAYTENVKSLNTTYAKLLDGTSTMIAYANIKTNGVHIKAKDLYDAGFARLAIEGLTADIEGFAIICGGVSIPWAVASLPENGQEKQYTGLSMFANIQCIGDSYTQGGIKSSDGNTWYQAKKPYPQVIADSLGVDVDNFGVGGATVKSYLTNGLANVLSATAPDLYMICFGINDCIAGDTIGTIADINDSDYTQNPDSFYGNYGRIITQLKTHAPLARFVIFGSWLWDKSGQIYSNYSNAAEEIAEHFGIPFVDPFDDPFFDSHLYHYTMVSGHPTQVTYTGLAYAVIRLMAKCIEENATYYRYAGLEAV